MMTGIYSVIYDIIIRTYGWGIWAASLWHPKARLWIEGRRGLFKRLINQIPATKDDRRTYWIHCASLGEFELSVPIIEAIKKRENALICVTFYSPSGFELRKNHPLIDVVSYLPYDTKDMMERFCDIVRPDIVLLVKYDFWQHMIQAIKRQGAKLYVVGARFRPQMLYFSYLLPLYRPLFNAVDGWFTQDEESRTLLRAHGYEQVWCFGDTRVDRTLAIAEAPFEHTPLQEWSRQKNTLILGSIWPEDLKVLAPILLNSRQEWQFIVAPHEVKDSSLATIGSMLSGLKTTRYQLWSTSPDFSTEVILIDHIGSLSKLYRFGNLAYVGGAFGKGLHNILEPLAYNIPVIFGPRHHKFPEAKSAMEAGVAFAISDTKDFERFMQEWSPKYWAQNSIKFQTFLGPSVQSASRIVDIIQNEMS